MLHWTSDGAKLRNVIVGAFAPKADRHSGDLLDLMGACMAYERGAEIFGQDEPAEYLYKVVSGTVRICTLMSDGRRQIGGFYLPGDILGLEAEDVHRFSAEAIGDCQVLAVRRTTFLAQASRDPDTVRQLWAQTLGHLQRAQNHMLLLGRKTAQERVAAFLLDMAERLPGSGSVELPMCRQDIADYLGLTIETVSRTLTQLERDGVIGIPVSRRILLRNRAELDRMNDCWAA